jgi:hypothetical protein
MVRVTLMSPKPAKTVVGAGTASTNPTAIVVGGWWVLPLDGYYIYIVIC